MKKFELSDVREAFDRLQTAGFQGVLVGGHSVNYWAHHYRQPTAEWDALLPYTSEDIDFLGGRAEALICKKLFGGKSNLNDGTDPSPQAGVILAPIGGQIIRFDIITSIIGVDSFDAKKNALIAQDKLNPHSTLRVQNPLHCLIGKTAALAQLPQGGRQDGKHLKLSILIVHAFLSERLGEVRPILNTVERIFDLAKGELGLRVWHRNGITIEKALPLEEIVGQQDERLEKFPAIRLPQLVSQLAEARERYEKSLSET